MKPSAANLECPVPLTASDQVLLAHGEGGRLTRQWIQSVVLRHLANPYLTPLSDAATLPPVNGPLAFTTDSFVVTPLFFPHTNIGELAVFGTVNDLVAAGAKPLWLSLAFIIEEGLPLATLERVLMSVAQAAAQANVTVVTGDTKVVPRGAADQLFINTAGIGKIWEPAPAGPAQLAVGDQILVSGPLGEHGLAVLAARENLGIEPAPQSDCRPLGQVAAALRLHQIPVKAMRDATRGGLAAVLHEWSAACHHSLHVQLDQLPVRSPTQALCELLGMEPIFIANEGVLVISVPPAFADQTLSILRTAGGCPEAQVVAEVVPRTVAAVTAQRSFGPVLALDEPAGAQLPRIC